MKIPNQKKNARQREFRKTSAALKLGSNCRNCGKPGPHFVPPSFGDPGFYSCAGKYALLIAVGRKNLETRRTIPAEDKAFLMREAANYEQMIDALETALDDVARLHDLNVRAAEVLTEGVEEVKRLEAERDLAQAHVEGAQAAYVSASDLRARTLNRALSAEAVIDRVKEARGQHPECAEHPEGDVISCGWKRVVLDIDAALEGTGENEPPLKLLEAAQRDNVNLANSKAKMAAAIATVTTSAREGLADCDDDYEMSALWVLETLLEGTAE